MSQYLRCRLSGGAYFFTVVTFERAPLLTSTIGIASLRLAFRHVRRRWPFDLVAYVVLPDHLHCIWNLPHGDSNFSKRWQKLKETFTRNYLAAGGRDGTTTSSRAKRQERALWQRRFWEHYCRDEADLKHHVDYIHWNPVKHGQACRAQDYRWSSFHRYVKLGEYDCDWGGCNPLPNFEAME